MTSVRARVRAEMIEEIKASARRHLATDGANLSLRAVARDLGLVSSALYRYFANRDELLTALIIDAYNDLGAEVERAEARVRRDDLAGRLAATAQAVRLWALANPPEYALVYGSPVPGYAAPEATIPPAQRTVLVLAGILRDGVAADVLRPVAGRRLGRGLRADLHRTAALMDIPEVPPELMGRAMGAWAYVFGVVSFELFGRLTNGVTDFDAFFTLQVRLISDHLGL